MPSPPKSSAGGIRAVDKHPPPLSLPVRAPQQRFAPHQQLPPRPVDYVSDESSSDVDIRAPPPTTTLGARRHDEESDEMDDTLWQIANKRKLRTHQIQPSAARKDGSLSSADSSSRHRHRKSVGDAFRTKSRPLPKISNLPPRPSARPVQLPPRPPQQHQPPLQRGAQFGNGDESDDSFDSDDESEDENDYGVVGAGPLEIDTLEEETLKAVRKAKLLARIEQLQQRNIKPSKTFNYRSNEEELMVEVARMEVLAERSIRITQGRVALSSTVKTVERIACYVDRKNYLPVKFGIGGFAKELVKDISDYDDCLERGVAETLGPSSSRVWWVECLWILIPSMLWYSLNNRMTEDPKYASEVMRENPEFQDRLAREMAKELSHAERVKQTQLESELQKLREENTFLQRSAPIAPLPAPVASSSAASATITTRGSLQNPPPRPLPNDNPLGDLPVDPSETARMQAFLAQQAQRRAVDTELASTVRQTVQEGMQNISATLLGDQRRAREQKKKPQPVARPRLPPPPSQRNVTTTKTIDLTGDDDDNDISLG